MFLYCITPYEKLESNFIKVGICENICLLKDRYSTYYGESCRYYYVKIKDKISEIKIHKKLKDLGLHLENELFSYNKVYDFYFYIKMLKDFENADGDNNDNCSDTTLIFNKKEEKKETDLYIYEQKHMFDFIINMSEKLQLKKYFDI